MSVIELIAVGLALAYVVLAIRERRSCWLAAAVSAALYAWIFAEARLYMESALQFFYIAMAAYGWMSWGQDRSGQQLPISRWTIRQHTIAIAGVLLASTASGFLLETYTQAALPWIDSFTTIAALVTTWMVARKVLENWVYWIVIDTVSIYLYLSRDLTLTAALFAGYVVLALAGYLEWQRHWRAQNAQGRD